MSEYVKRDNDENELFAKTDTINWKFLFSYESKDKI